LIFAKLTLLAPWKITVILGAQMPNIKKYILNIIGQFKDKSVYCNFELLMIRVVFGVCE